MLSTQQLRAEPRETATRRERNISLVVYRVPRFNLERETTSADVGHAIRGPRMPLSELLIPPYDAGMIDSPSRGRRVSGMSARRFQRWSDWMVDGCRTLRGRLERNPSPVGFPTRWILDTDVPMVFFVPRWARRSGRIARWLASHVRSVCLPAAPTDAQRCTAEQWSLAGIPIRTSGSNSVLGATSEGLFERERLSVLCRREAWRTAVSQEANISIVMSTKRPAALVGALSLMDSQSLRPTSVLVGLHGAEWDGVPTALSEFAGLAIEVRSYDDDRTLGFVLDDLSRAAPPGILTKWDDDDWYGSDHLLDLVAASSFSKATLVGKGADFVYLEASDTTVRRKSRRAEGFGRLVAGGTIAIDRDDLAAVGGWPNEPRHVDKGLIERVRAAGGTTYRTHGFGYLLHRAGSTGDHTWSAEDHYFLNRAEQKWDGRRIDIVGPFGVSEDGYYWHGR